MDLSWIKGTIRGWTVLAWWVILPVRAVAMILSIAADLIFVGIFVFFIALWMGMIPDSAIRSTLDQVGRKVESYVMPEFKAALRPPATSQSSLSSPPGAAPLAVPHPAGENAARDALLSDHPGVDQSSEAGHK